MTNFSGKSNKKKMVKIKRLDYKYDRESFTLDDVLKEVERNFERESRKEIKKK